MVVCSVSVVCRLCRHLCSSSCTYCVVGEDVAWPVWRFFVIIAVLILQLDIETAVSGNLVDFGGFFIFLSSPVSGFVYIFASVLNCIWRNGGGQLFVDGGSIWLNVRSTRRSNKQIFCCTDVYCPCFATGLWFWAIHFLHHVPFAELWLPVNELVGKKACSWNLLLVIAAVRGVAAASSAYHRFPSLSPHGRVGTRQIANLFFFAAACVRKHFFRRGCHLLCCFSLILAGMRSGFSRRKKSVNYLPHCFESTPLGWPLSGWGSLRWCRLWDPVLFDPIQS